MTHSRHYTFTEEKLENLWNNMRDDMKVVQEGITECANFIPAIKEAPKNGFSSDSEYYAWEAYRALEAFKNAFEEEFYNPMSNLLKHTKEFCIFIVSLDDEDDIENNEYPSED